METTQLQQIYHRVHGLNGHVRASATYGKQGEGPENKSDVFSKDLHAEPDCQRPFSGRTPSVGAAPVFVVSPGADRPKLGHSLVPATDVMPSVKRVSQVMTATCNYSSIKHGFHNTLRVHG